MKQNLKEMLSGRIAKIAKKPPMTNMVMGFCMLGILACQLDPMVVTCFCLRGGLLGD